MLEVGPTRYEAGRFGSGFKPRPKSDAGIRQVPLAPLVVEAIHRQLPPAATPTTWCPPVPAAARACPEAPARCCHATTSTGPTTTGWAALPVAHDPLLDAVDLHGAHDPRHTYATWLEDAGIPARVIDELMGHQASTRGGLRGSAIGAHYRHTTPEMAARVVDATQQRLTIVLGVAELALSVTRTGQR